MRLNFKVVIYLFLFFLSIHNVFSQDKLITAKFNQDGHLYGDLEDFSQSLVKFKEGENCIVISYLGNYVYKIKYKEWEGFVKDQFLITNEKMMDLFFAHEEKQRNTAIKKREVRQEQINQLRRKDSITKAKEKKRLQNIALENARIKQEETNQRRIEDSITKVENLQKIRAQNIEYDRLEKLKALQKIKDSIQRIKEAETKQMLALKAAKIEEKKLAEQKKLDSIAKVENLQKIREQNFEYYRLEKLKALQKIKDSIQRIKETERKQNETLESVRIKQEQINQRRREDSITKTKEEIGKEIKSLEEIKSRNACSYIINEYDNFYKKQVIITDKYIINENLNIELIREGNTSKIHINTTENLGCASYVPNTRSSVSVTLKNNQVIIFYHSGSLDCNDFSLKATLSQSKINQLKGSPIKSFTFRGTKRSLTISDIDYHNFFIDKLKCIE